MNEMVLEAKVRERFNDMRKTIRNMRPVEAQYMLDKYVRKEIEEGRVPYRPHWKWDLPYNEYGDLVTAAWYRLNPTDVPT
jgi:hypothetical protein